MSGSFARYARLTAFGAAASGAGRFIYLALVGRFLGPQILGSTTYIVSLFVTFGGFVALTVGDAITRFVAEKIGSENSDTGVKQFSGIITIFLLLFLSVTMLALLMDYLGFPILQPDLFDISLLEVLILVGSFCVYGLVRSAMYGFGLIKQYGILEIVFNIVFVGSGAFVILYMPQFYLQPLLILYGGFSIVGIMFLQSRGYLTIGLDSSKHLITSEKGIISFIGITSIIGVTGLINGSAPLVMTLFLTDLDIGFYGSASAFLVFVSFLPLVLNRAALPTVSHKHGKKNPEELNNFVNRGFKTILEAQLALSVELILFAPLALDLLFGSGYLVASSTLRILILNAYLGGTASYFYSVLAGIGSIGKAAKASVISTITILISWFFLIPYFGIEGTAIALVFGSAIRMILMGYWTNKAVGLRLRRRTILLITMTACMCLIGLFAEAIQSIPALLLIAIIGAALGLILLIPLISAFRSTR
jgi:O-antigen/teichoic acid export membrane protein